MAKYVWIGLVVFGFFGGFEFLSHYFKNANTITKDQMAVVVGLIMLQLMAMGAK